MPKIHVITDSDSSLPMDLAANLGIQQVPITIQFGEESFETGIDIDDRLLFEKIDRIGKLPTTAAPSPAAFVKAYRKAFDSGADSIIAVCVGSKISRTYESAINAVEEFPGCMITVVDSEYLSLGQGFMAIAAAEAAAGGSSHQEAVLAAQSVLPNLHLYGSLSTLKYLAMGGRIGHLAAGMGNMLNIRPILTVKDGKLDLLEKVRTRKVALERLVQLFEQSVGSKEVIKVGLVHINNPNDALELEQQLRTRLKLPKDHLLAEFTPGLSVHAGAGMVAAILVTK
jgi:DegV family protein with EDD domain